MKKIGWTVVETQGIGIINPRIFLPEEEYKALIDKEKEKMRILQEEGEVPEPGEVFVCPKGCDGPFRTHGGWTTLLGWINGPDPNHHTLSCSCQSCGTRFTKHWVPSKNDGKPWFVEGDTWENRRVYSGECQCCCSNENLEEII